MSLPNSTIPRELREHGIKAIHQRPFCANEDSHIVGRFDPEYAWANFPKLELQPPHVWAAIVLDCDTPSESGWPGGKPSIPPSWMVINTRRGTPERRPGGIHAVYALEVPVARHDAAHGLPLAYLSHVLEVPVARHDAAHGLPLAYLSHVADRLAYHLGADPGYTGLITRNPINPGPECFTHWGRMFPYTLSELDKHLPKGKLSKRRLTGIGRNCDLFWSMVSEVFRPRWADTLSAQGWTEGWLDHVRGQNVAMFAPDVLPDSECRSIAKSCFRYWTLNYDPERFSEIQTARNGKRWHGDYAFDFDQQAQDVHKLKAWGLKQVTIGAVVNLSQPRVSRILSRSL